jgi:Rrf2 family protein
LNFTSKEEYGLRAVMHLALHEASWPIQSREIAGAEGIPEQFLEQVLAALRRSSIVRSIRGASGGYELARNARSITAGDVLRALSGPIAPIPCDDDTSEKCDNVDRSVVMDLWQKVQSAIVQVLDGTTIQDMVDEKLSREQQSSFMMNI